MHKLLPLTENLGLVVIWSEGIEAWSSISMAEVSFCFAIVQKLAYGGATYVFWFTFDETLSQKCPGFFYLGFF